MRYSSIYTPSRLAMPGFKNYLDDDYYESLGFLLSVLKLYTIDEVNK